MICAQPCLLKNPVGARHYTSFISRLSNMAQDLRCDRLRSLTPPQIIACLIWFVMYSPNYSQCSICSDWKSFVNPSSCHLPLQTHQSQRSMSSFSELNAHLPSLSAFICEGLSCAISQLNETKIAPKVFEQRRKSIALVLKHIMSNSPSNLLG